MVKNLASSFLSTKSTIMEYDLKQAKSMQSGMIVNMMFMWFLHFKMEQVQPLLIQALTGLVNLIYSPLFQVYVLGRNLERPFKNPAMKKLEEAAEKASEQASTNEEEDDEVVSIEEVATTEESESDSEDEDESAAEGEEEVVEKETEQIDEASDEVSVQSDKQPAEEESDDAAEEDSEDA